MIRGIIKQESPSMDTSLNKAILDILFCDTNCDIPGGFGQHLAARNIQHGRDHGLPSYTKYRDFCDLPALLCLLEALQKWEMEMALLVQHLAV